MREKTLADSAKTNPEINEKIKDASGYAVFSNANINIIFISAGDGYGLVHDNKTNEETFMKMGLGGLGLGIGVKDYRSIIIFYTELALANFLHSGWEFGGQADATAKAGEKGGDVGGAGEFKSDVEIYQFTKNGFALQATVTGAKYWKDNDLNEK
jgi:lipid-binding SYLF domain-containing protein